VTESAPFSSDSAVDLPEQMRVRREKLDRIRAAGGDPYPVGFPRTVMIAELQAAFPDLAVDTATGRSVGIAGRVMRSRIGGKLCFATVVDGGGDTGGEMQVMLSADRLGEEALARWKSDVDLGDHVGFEGEVISSRRGELSVLVDRWALTAKCLRPLPDKHGGLVDPEARVRQRYVDLVVNPEARSMVRTRATVLRSLRTTLDQRGFVEVETPILQPVHGGAAARPFTTHLNAFDTPMFLRIALELYLKRLVVGGIERVYEIGRNFRNEGVDSTHNPEFTMLESYQAYGDYNVMATLTKELLVNAAVACGGTVIPDGRGGDIDLADPWREVTIHDAVTEVIGEKITVETEVSELEKLAELQNVALRPGCSSGEIVVELFEKLVEHTLITPTFVRDYPAEARPLARPHRTEPGLVEAWDLIIGGMELGVAYSELVDPVEQRRRLMEQSRQAAKGDPEAMSLDEDFLRALEYAMPPTGGMGLGVDRCVMLLAGRNIRESVLFPMIRPE
jgi:lysyl-tRNA synthetase, class II